MALNIELFKEVVAPEFSEKSDDLLQLFADQAECQISQKKWGKRYDLGVAYLTAHMCAMADKSKNNKSSSTGQLKRVKVGQLEREYEVGDQSGDDSYDLTTYGKEFKRLRKQILFGPIITSSKC